MGAEVFRLAGRQRDVVLAAAIPQSVTGFNETANNMPVAANEYIVFVGARDLGSSTLGSGGRRVVGSGAGPERRLHVREKSIRFEQIHEQFVDYGEHSR